MLVAFQVDSVKGYRTIRGKAISPIYRLKIAGDALATDNNNVRGVVGVRHMVQILHSNITVSSADARA